MTHEDRILDKILPLETNQHEMKLSIGNRVSYHPENSFPPSIHDGHTYTGTVTYVRAIPADMSGFQHDRANVEIDPNPQNLISIECNQKFLDKINS